MGISHRCVFSLQLFRRHLATGETPPVPSPILRFELSELYEGHGLNAPFFRPTHTAIHYGAISAGQARFRNVETGKLLTRG